MKRGDSVYVYSLAMNGSVHERMGTITAIHPKHIVVRFPDSCNSIVLSKKKNTIERDAMWSTMPHKYVYAEKMLDILAARREDYRNRTVTIGQKIVRLRESLQPN